MSEKKVDRRTYLKYSGAAVGGLIVGGALGYLAKPAEVVEKTATVTAPGVATTVTKTVTTAAPLKPVEITLVCDSGHNFIPWFDPEEAPSGGHFGQNQAPKIEKALGITIKGDQVDPGTEYSLYMADLTGPGKWNIIVYFPTYNGDIMGGGWLVPLDPYIEKYQVNMYDIPAPFRLLYCGWGGKIYGLPYDGDFHALYYRKDIFAKKEIRDKFKVKYGYDLAPPTTYKEYLDIAEFFAGWDWDGDGEVEYGTVEDFKDLTWGIFIDRFASVGGMWFDENMNPLTPNDAAVKALEDLVKIIDFMPPGALEFGALEVFDCMTKGITAMVLTWPDVGPRAGSGEFPIKGDQVGTALVPGYPVGGTIRRMSWTGVGRIMSISIHTPEEKREAAFLILKWMFDTSHMWVPSGLNGEDPFSYRITGPGALYYWQKANPGWSAEGILDYMAAAQENMAHGFPDLYIPGTAQYTDALSRYIMLAATKQIKPKEAIDNVVSEWRKITKDLGEDKQKEAWKNQVIQYRAAGIWPF